MQQTVWVLWWAYSDGSACGVVRAYFCEQRAKEDRELLAEADAGRVFTLEPVPVYGSPGPCC